MKVPATTSVAGDGRDRILDVAERLFGTHSVHEVTFRMIADAAACSVGLIHHHFATKDGLLAEIVRRRVQPLSDRWAHTGAAAKSAESCIASFVRLFLGEHAVATEGGLLFLRLFAHQRFVAEWLDHESFAAFDELERAFVERLSAADRRISQDTARLVCSHVLSVIAWVVLDYYYLQNEAGRDVSAVLFFGSARERAVRYSTGGALALIGLPSRTGTKRLRLRPQDLSDQARPVRERILDAAEYLFADFDPAGVSLRDITREADVTASLLRYHFGGKEGLVTAAFERRGWEMHALCTAHLERARLRIEQGAVPLDEMSSAFVKPSGEFFARHGLRGLAYARFFIKLLLAPRWHGSIRRVYDRIGNESLAVLQHGVTPSRTRPGACDLGLLRAPLLVYWLSLGPPRLRPVKGGISVDLEGNEAATIAFIRGGFARLSKDYKSSNA